MYVKLCHFYWKGMRFTFLRRVWLCTRLCNDFLWLNLKKIIQKFANDVYCSHIAMFFLNLILKTNAWNWKCYIQHSSYYRTWALRITCIHIHALVFYKFAYMGTNEVIGTTINIIGVLFGVHFGVLMEYSIKKFHQFHQISF